MSTYHILNGDSLLQYINEHHLVKGEFIVLRECLVDGPVQHESIEDLFEKRAQFLATAYGESTMDYQASSVSEFKKISSIPPNSNIHLWFEEDLFCQVNLWFACYLLSKTDLQGSHVYLVLPSKEHPYSFASMQTEELLDAYSNKLRLELDDLHLLANFWLEYAKGNYYLLHTLATQVEEKFPFLLKATKANIVLHNPDEHSKSPTQTLKIMLDLHGAENFGLIFQEFTRFHTELGFGDLQVMRMLKELQK